MVTDPKHMDIEEVEELADSLRADPPLSLEEVRQGRRTDKRNRKIWIGLIRARTITKLAEVHSEEDAEAEHDYALSKVVAEGQNDS